MVVRLFFAAALLACLPGCGLLSILVLANKGGGPIFRTSEPAPPPAGPMIYGTPIGCSEPFLMSAPPTTADDPAPQTTAK